MKIENLVATPKLIELVLDDENIINTYGESIIFYTYDVVSMTTYFNFFNARSENHFEELTNLIRKMILNSDGKPVINDSQELPIDIMAGCITKLGDILGKSLGKTSTQRAGQTLV